MKLPGSLAIGVASHCGLVRGSNEDDYLLVAPGDPATLLLAAIADGMGGVAGGAEASRTALRGMAASALGGEVVAGDGAHLARAFHEANDRVLEAAAAVPSLREMGTTLTAVWLGRDGRAAFGHIGDTRLYRFRGGIAEQVTNDHAAAEGEHLLTRCIGAGQRRIEPEHAALAIDTGDRLVLVTDGIWNVIEPRVFDELVRSSKQPQVAAERLVQATLERGAPDNATAVVIDLLVDGAERDVDLPRGERSGVRGWPAVRSLRAPWWAWGMAIAAVTLLAAVALHRSGFDPLAWFASR